MENLKPRKEKLANGRFNYFIPNHRNLLNSKKDYVAYCFGAFFGTLDSLYKFQKTKSNKYKDKKYQETQEELKNPIIF